MKNGIVGAVFWGVLVISPAVWAGFVVEEGAMDRIAPPTRAQQQQKQQQEKAEHEVIKKAADMPQQKLVPVNAAKASPSAAAAQGFQLVSVSYIGDPPADIPVLEGFGQDVRLLDAVSRIAPTGWHVFLKEDLVSKDAADLKASWTGGRRWVEVLDIVGNDLGLAIEIDWVRHHVYVGKKIVSATGNGGDKGKKPSQVFVVKPGSLLRDTLGEWAKQAGWTMVWDYPEREGRPQLDAGNVYKKDFKTNVRDLFNSLPANIHITAVLSSDNTPPLLFVTRDDWKGFHQ